MITRIAGTGAPRGSTPGPTIGAEPLPQPPVFVQPTPPVIDGNWVMLDPSQAGAPGGTVRVRGALDGRPLRVRPSVRDFVTRLRTGRV